MPSVAAFRALVLGFAAALLVGASAHADIRSFNAAMNAGDFKTAAAEAVSTWPTLDASRDDLAIIAREFGFAAYMAGDFAAARTFGEAAIASGAALGEDESDRAVSDVLRDVAIHKLSPSAATRDQLVRSLQVRVTLPANDLISYVAADVVTTYDFARGAWPEAEASAVLGLQLSEAGGPDYLDYVFRYDLLGNVAEYMRTQEVNVYDQLVSLRRKARAAINAASSDESAEPFADIYWQTRAWANAIGSHLVGNRKMKWPEAPESTEQPGDRAPRLLGDRDPEAVCRSHVYMRREIPYPKSAIYSGFHGTVMLRVDVDAAGVVSNSEVLASVPDKRFADAVMGSVWNIRYRRYVDAPPTCSLAQTGRVITFVFVVR